MIIVDHYKYAGVGCASVFGVDTAWEAMYHCGNASPHYPVPALYDGYDNPAAWTMDWLLNAWQNELANWAQKYIKD